MRGIVVILPDGVEGVSLFAIADVSYLFRAQDHVIQLRLQ